MRPSFRDEEEYEDGERITGLDASLISNGRELAHWSGDYAAMHWFNLAFPLTNDYQDALIEREPLSLLLATCCRVSAHYTLARQLLPDPRPAAKGFRPYQADYFTNLERTIDQLEHVLSVRPLGDIYYQSLWPIGPIEPE